MADGKTGFVWACASVWCGLSQRNDHTNGRPGPAHRQIISVGRIGGISAGEAIMAHSTHKASPLFRFTKPDPKVNNLSTSTVHQLLPCLSISRVILVAQKTSFTRMFFSKWEGNFKDWLQRCLPVHKARHGGRG